MTPERLSQIAAQPQTTVVERLVAAEMLPECVKEIERLREEMSNMVFHLRALQSAYLRGHRATATALAEREFTCSADAKEKA